jgi:uncharacterized protein YutE (UPF0331/DUF86 family)
MLNLELIEERINQIRTSANRMAKMKILSKEAFLADPDNFAIAEHHLRRALEALFDIGRHIVAKKGFGRPENYKSVIEILGRNSIISMDFSKEILGMAGYRNRLVHGYANVTAEEMYHVIEDRLDDFARFSVEIAAFIEKEKANSFNTTD